MDESRPHPQPAESPQGGPAENSAPVAETHGGSVVPQENAPTEIIPAVETPVPEADALHESSSSGGVHEAPALQRPPARWPSITLIVVGALLVMPGSLLVWFAYFVIGLNLLGSSDTEISGGEIPNGGSISLLEETTYSIDAYNTSFPEDLPDPTGSPAERDAAAALLPQCTVQGPDGADIPVEPQPVGFDMPDVLAFTTEAAGEYTATCESEALAGEVQLSIFEFVPGDEGVPAAGVAPIASAVITAVVGLALLAVGIVRLVRGNRRRRELREQAAAVVAEWQAAADGAVDGETVQLAAGVPVPGVAAAPALPEPKPSDDPRVVFSPENAFGTGKSNGKPPSMVPAILGIVLGALMLVGGPIGGALAPVLGVLANPDSLYEGGTVQNGDSLELSANKLVGFYATESSENLPQSEADWENYRPPPTPECSITDPNGDPVELKVEDMGGGYENATFTTTDSGEYTFQCQLDSRYDGSFSIYPMGDADATGMPKTMLVGLVVGGIGFVILIVSIVFAVRTSAKRHDAGV